MSENFIAAQGPLSAFHVIMKEEWVKLKEEMRSIKREIALLNPQHMFQPTVQQKQAMSNDEANKVMKSEKQMEAVVGSIVRIKGLT